MASVVEICNLALSNIRAGSINNINEKTVAAENCKLKYNVLRDQLLRDAPWKFAHVVEPLALLTVTLPGWTYAYQHPSDCVGINHLTTSIGTDQQIRFNIFIIQCFKRRW